MFVSFVHRKSQRNSDRDVTKNLDQSKDQALFKYYQRSEVANELARRSELWKT